MSSVLEGLLQQCCSSHLDQGQTSEVRVLALSSDYRDAEHDPVHWQDPLAYLEGDRVPTLLEQQQCSTPHQKTIQERVCLPHLRRYPVPPHCAEDDPEDVQRQELLLTFQQFVMDLHRGLHAVQLAADQSHSSVHCQILDDLQTLKVDQGSGCIIEFPLGSVSKLYRILRNDERWEDSGELSSRSVSEEHVVVMEFMGRKLPFLFHDIDSARRFLMCMELTIRRAQELRRESDVSSVGRERGAGGMVPLFSSAHVVAAAGCPAWGGTRGGTASHLAGRPLEGRSPLSSSSEKSSPPFYQIGGQDDI